VGVVVELVVVGLVVVGVVLVLVGVLELVVVGVVLVPVVGDVLSLLELLPSPTPLPALEPLDPEVVVCCELPLEPLGCVEPVGCVAVGVVDPDELPEPDWPELGWVGAAAGWLGAALGACPEGLGCGDADGGGGADPWLWPGWPG
jgi:hypothetical protein